MHILPHSHLDPGWLKTVDEYFHGCSGLANYNINVIFSNLVNSLHMHAHRKTIYAEIVYVDMWYKD